MTDQNIYKGLKELHLPTMSQTYKNLAQKALEETVSFEQYLQWLVEQELEERRKSRIIKRLTASKIPLSKSLENFDIKRLPLKLSRQIKSLTDGQFVKQKENILLFGNPGSGKTHLLCAIGQELIRRHDLKILFIQSGHLLQELLSAKKNFILPKILKKFLNYDGLIIDDIGYVQQSKDEVEVLFALIAECYERTSILISSNLPFSKWDQIFKDPMMTAASIDRLIHHSVILEINMPSYRLEKSKEKHNKQKEEL